MRHARVRAPRRGPHVTVKERLAGRARIVEAAFEKLAHDIMLALTALWLRQIAVNSWRERLPGCQSKPYESQTICLILECRRSRARRNLARPCIRGPQQTRTNETGMPKRTQQ
jgi:hypothetical protein